LKKEILIKKEMLTNSRKKWTLDEDGDDDEEPSVPDPADQEENGLEDGLGGPPGAPPGRPGPPGLGEDDEGKEGPLPVKMEVEADDDEDPLDAFMKTVQAEVRKVNVNNGGESE
jgi:hypothetical protein